MRFAAKPLLAVAGVAAALMATPPAAATPPLLPAGRFCLDPAASPDYTVVRPGSGFEVLARPSARALAGRVHDIVARRIWPRWVAGFREGGGTGQPLGRPGRRFQIFVVPHREFPAGEAGATEAYCAADRVPRFFAVAIPDDLEHRGRYGNLLATALAHETFHAFAHGVTGVIRADWWAEATAAWAETLVAPNAAQIQGEDAAFLSRPEVPLDDFSPRSLHPYGAFRFVQWTAFEEVLAGRSPWTLVVGAFRREAAGEAAIDAVVNEFEARRIDAAFTGTFGESLANFWGQALFASPDPTGEFATGTPRPWAAPAAPQHDLGSIGSSLTWTPHAQPLAAELVRAAVTPSCMRITLRSIDPEAFAYVWEGNHNGTGNVLMIFAQPGPTGFPFTTFTYTGTMRAAFVNGGVTPAGASITFGPTRPFPC